MFFPNWFSSKELPELEKEYQLLHDVLAILRGTGISSSTVGTPENGYKPIYEYSLNTGWLEFATIGAILNKADIIKLDSNDIKRLQKLDVREEDVPITRCTWEQLSKAIDTLEAAGEIEKKMTEVGLVAVVQKSIHLTIIGMYSFNTRKYILLLNSEKNKRDLQDSTLTTNYLTRWFTGFVAAATVVSVFIGVCNMPDKQYNKEVLKALQQISKSMSSPPIHTDTNLPVKKLVSDSIPQKK